MRALRFIVLSLAAQLIGWSFADGICSLLPVLSPLHLVLWMGASWVVMCLGEASLPWQLVNAVLPIALALSSSANVPAWPFLILLIALILIYLPTVRFGVPFYPTPREVYRAIGENLPKQESFKFLDIGCGFGTMLAALAREFPHGTFRGVELAPLPFIIGRIRSLFARNRNLSIQMKSLWDTSLTDVDVVYAFLAPPPMAKLWDKVMREMRPGTLFITNTFPVPAEADEQRVVAAGRGGVLFLHRIGESSAA